MNGTDIHNHYFKQEMIQQIKKQMKFIDQLMKDQMKEGKIEEIKKLKKN